MRRKFVAKRLNSPVRCSRLPLAVLGLWCLLLLSTGKALAEFPVILGSWNSFHNQRNIAECANPRRSPVHLAFAVRTDRNVELRAFELVIGGNATLHIDLTGDTPADAYGTYLIRELSPTPEALNLVCTTSLYRFSKPGKPRVVEYAFSIPAIVSLEGISAGIYNSYRPDGTPGVVFNWLSVLNVSDQNFTGRVDVFRQDGTFDSDASFAITTPLVPGERRDFAIGHPQGQRVGVYQLVPNNMSQPYGLFLTRYNPDSIDEFVYAFPTLARKPYCGQMVLPASTMDPAYNWAEIANPRAGARTADFAVYDALGAEKVNKQIAIGGFSQHHELLNTYIGERAVGSFRVKCAEPAPNSEGFIVQSAYYGRRGDKVDWAYVTQGTPQASGDERFAHLYNSFLGAANWNKFLSNEAAESASDLITFDTQGFLAKMRSEPVLPSGAVDVPLHLDAGYNSIGMSLSQRSVSGALLTSDLLRVFPDSRGGLGYIMNVAAQPVKPDHNALARARALPSARVFEIDGRPQVVVGESITQAWMELGTDFDQDAFLDILKDRGINMLMIWSYIGIDDQTADSRIGYHAPRIWPWIETNFTFVPPYKFIFASPSLLLPMFNEKYFNRLRDLARGANERGITLLITIHDGWTKARFAGHPMNVANGGNLNTREEYVVLATPGVEMPKLFNHDWNPQQKHQWILERFTEKLLESTSEYQNVMYEVMNEGEWYNPPFMDAFQKHFVDFIHARTSRILIVNQLMNAPTDYQQNAQTDVVSHHFPNWTNATPSSSSFNYYGERWLSSNTKKPLLFDEPVPGYVGGAPARLALLRLMWGTLLGQGGFVLQDDANWKMTAANVDVLIDRLGYAAKFFNNNGPRFWEMSPAGQLSSTGVCLAKQGEEYVIYSDESPGTGLSIDLTAASGTFTARFFNPFTGVFGSQSTLEGGAIRSIDKPNSADWVLWLKKQ